MRDARVRRHEARCVWNADATLGEGPLWSARDAALYWVDIIEGDVHRFVPGTGERATCRMPCAMSALALCDDGGLLCTAQRDICVFDLDSGSLHRVLSLRTDAQNIRINDGCCHPDGSFWFGTMDLAEIDPTGTFHRLAPDGVCEHVPVMTCAITNGPAFSADGAIGYFVDTLGGRLFQARLDAGMLAEPLRDFARIAQADGFPDGLATDSAGGVWCAHWNGSRVTRFDPDGRITDVVSLPVSNVTKCAFGGAQMDRLYITTARKGLDANALDAQPLAGGLFDVDVGYSGLPAPFYAGRAARSVAIANDCVFVGN